MDNPFLKNAGALFDTARAGVDDCDLAMVVGRDGAVDMREGAGWELEPLRLHCGAQAAYRVVRRGGVVRVEARSAQENCVLEAKLAVHNRPVFVDFPRYRMIS